MNNKLGKPIRWTDKELARQAITPDDMQAALIAWQANAPDEYDDLPLAPQDEGDNTAEKVFVGLALLATSTRFLWDANRGVYLDKQTGNALSFLEVREVVDSVNLVQLGRMKQLSESLQAGQITLSEWQLGMAQNIKIVNVNASVLARGGYAQMSPSDWGWTGSEVKKQYKYLRNFAEEISNGKQSLDGRFLVRSQMYEDAARGSYEDMRRRVEENNNLMEEEMRELGEADHCPDCLDAAALGWQPIGTLPRIGESVCRTNCHCTFKFRRLGQDGEYIYSDGN